jgi:hypothetical protein
MYIVHIMNLTIDIWTLNFFYSNLKIDILILKTVILIFKKKY